MKSEKKKNETPRALLLLFVRSDARAIKKVSVCKRTLARQSEMSIGIGNAREVRGGRPDARNVDSITRQLLRCLPAIHSIDRVLFPKLPSKQPFLLPILLLSSTFQSQKLEWSAFHYCTRSTKVASPLTNLHAKLYACQT